MLELDIKELVRLLFYFIPGILTLLAGILIFFFNERDKNIKFRHKYYAMQDTVTNLLNNFVKEVDDLQKHLREENKELRQRIRRLEQNDE